MFFSYNYSNYVVTWLTTPYIERNMIRFKLEDLNELENTHFIF